MPVGLFPYWTDTERREVHFGFTDAGEIPGQHAAAKRVIAHIMKIC
jgi:hypothetical protein